MVNFTDIKIRGFHLDPLGHVSHTRYFEFIELARWKAFEKTLDLLELHRMGYDFTIVNISINFRGAAVNNDILTVETEVIQWGRKHAVMRQLVRLKETDILVAEATVTFVIVDSQKQEPALLEGKLLEMLQLVDLGDH
jgi:thioesterase III